MSRARKIQRGKTKAASNRRQSESTENVPAMGRKVFRSVTQRRAGGSCRDNSAALRIKESRRRMTHTTQGGRCDGGMKIERRTLVHFPAEGCSRSLSSPATEWQHCSWPKMPEMRIFTYASPSANASNGAYPLPFAPPPPPSSTCRRAASFYSGSVSVIQFHAVPFRAGLSKNRSRTHPRNFRCENSSKFLETFRSALRM